MVKKKRQNLWKGRWIFYALSAVWVCMALYGCVTYGWIGRFSDLTPAEFVIQISALFFPVGVFFLLGVYLDRNQMAAQEMQSIKSYLEELVYPSDLGAQHVQSLNSELKQQIQSFRSSFSDVSNQTNKVREDLNKWIESLNKIIEHMNKQTQQMADYVVRLGVASKDAEEQTAEACHNLATQADILIQVTDETNSRLTEGSKVLQAQTEAIAQTVHAVSQAEKNIENSLDKSSTLVTTLGENARKIEKSMKATDTIRQYLNDTDAALMRVKELGTIMDMRLKNMKGQEKQLKSSEAIQVPVAKQFTEQMQHIMEKLQGLSVEMMSVFQFKNEEELWDHYYAGDKAVFMRQIKTMLTTNKRQKILDMSVLSPEFQKNVEEYMTTFESLIKGLENSPWLGVLVGSDPGRLYMVLATLFKGGKNASKVS